MGGYGVFLIAALIVVSGVIAYVGDVIGRRMGRRRLTLFNLRPRHTAVVISVVAGMLIAGFTLISAILVSQDVRDALLHAAAIREENTRLERIRHELEAGIATSRARTARAEQRLGQVARRMRDVAATLERQTGQLTGARRRLRQVGGELRAKAAELEATRGGLKAAASRLRTIGTELSQRERELAARDQDLRATRAKLQTESAELTRVETELENASASAFKAGRSLIDLENKRDQLQAQIQELTQWRSRALQAFGEIRTEPVIFRANEEILTTVVPGGRSEREVSADLRDFVERVNRVALSAGAAPQSNGRGVNFSRLTLDQPSNQIILYDENQVLDALAKAIAGQRGSVVVRAASAGNAVRGETVLVNFDLFQNRLVLHQGDELARTTVDSSLDQASALIELVAFLRGGVSARAREVGIMPHSGGRPGEDAPPLFSGPDAVVGEMRYPELLRVIRDIKSHKGKVGVVARAAADTWTAGPLRVKLEVEGRA